ncbi:MAG: Primosomal replication protein N [Paracidovorax wautersii]|uniref:Replication restart protein PriB n=1 Tax=Paracidovorax wautersii TaxID=1177982 RepID=A0A7V8FNG4_9BURK|nr:MAG: Primosomal replication protein N [Paracidovorax wautersii]
MNQVALVAVVAEVAAMRYTPAGLPALDLRLEHESQVKEAGQPRQVRFELKAVAFADMAERLARQPIGSRWQFKGFLSNTRNGKGLLLHIQHIDQD